MSMKSISIMLICAGMLSAETVTLTGWFSDEGCARSRVTAGNISPNGPDCVKKCLDNGARAVFLSEQGKELLIVTGYAKAKDDVGYRIEITGVRDETTKSFSVESVKRIGDYQPVSCARPKKTK